ncbi:hypothetical protein [Halocatena pleomorpha]|uniref:hypothetical protein n=1 Tax=Halocatena pleomorpha TaxID=1785090 RepID=UPI0016394E14|nr:hypothetical protein [Halocatena pleomorpha]
MLKHVAYSEDESHGSLGSVPKGFHPAAAPVLEDGTVQVAVPDELRTNVHFHPLCRWCGKKFYLIENYIEHINDNEESLDGNCHRSGSRRSKRPLLVPFSRDGTVIPMIPPLTELTGNLDEATAFDRKKRSESDSSLDSNKSETTAEQISYTRIETMNKENRNVSSDAATSPEEMDGDDPSNDETEQEKRSPTAVIDRDRDSKEKNSATRSEKSDQVTTATKEAVNKKTVKIDGVLVALVDLIVEKETTEYDSRTALLDTALEEFLGSVITDGQTSFDDQITTSRRFDIKTDPVLKYLLEEIVKDQEEFSSYHEFVQHTLLDQLDIDAGANEILIPNYNRYAFVIEQLIQIDANPYETSSHIVHTALENHLKI